MASEKSVKSQVGMGLIIAGVILAFPGVSLVLRGEVSQGLMLLVIPAALVIGGLFLKKSSGTS